MNRSNPDLKFYDMIDCLVPLFVFPEFSMTFHLVLKWMHGSAPKREMRCIHAHTISSRNIPPK